MADNKPTVSAADTSFRHSLARWVLFTSIGGILLLSGIVILKGNGESAKYVFAAVLPLIGTWVGTLIAFYFSKENFEAATKSVRKMAQEMTGVEKLRSIKVLEVMRKFEDMIAQDVVKDGEDQLKLDDLLTKFKDLERMPLVENKQMAYLVYKGMVYRFISQKAIKKEDVSDLSVKDLLDSDPALKELFTKSYGFVSKQATLAEAKTVMDTLSKVVKCEDVFITQNGQSNEPVLGWVTNKTIARYAKVE